MKISDKSYFKKTGHTTVFSLRLDEEVYRLIKEVAKAEHRSINSQLADFIEGALTEYFDEHPD